MLLLCLVDSFLKGTKVQMLSYPSCLTRFSPRFIINGVQIKFMNRDSIDSPNSINVNMLVVFCSSYSVFSSGGSPCFKIPVDRGCIWGPAKRILDCRQLLSGRYSGDRINFLQMMISHYLFIFSSIKLHANYCPLKFEAAYTSAFSVIFNVLEVTH